MLPEWYQEAEKLYEQNKSFTEIGKVLNISRKQVSYWLQLKGHKPNHKFMKNRANHRKYQVDEHFFDTIDTEAKAYWLGFMYADGYVSEKTTQIELQLKEGDRSHLEKLLSSLKSNRPLYQTKKEVKDTVYIGWRLTVNSVTMKDALIANGCGIRKTFTIQFPTIDIVPKHLQHHFIRGYVEGDGCITYTSGGAISIELVGTREFLKGYISVLGLHENKIHYINNKTNVCRVMYSGKYAHKIIQQIYKDASIFLDRKYEIVKDLLPSIGESR